MALFCDFENIALASATPITRSSTSARCSSACYQRQHRRQEGLLRLGPPQGVQGAEASFELIEIASGSRARIPLISAWSSTLDSATQGARANVRHHQRRLRFLAAGFQARENDKVIGVGVKNYIRPADRQLRRSSSTTTWCGKEAERRDARRQKQ
jgi:hypothetical protein